MKAIFFRVMIGCLVAAVSAAIDGLILVLADPEHVFENPKSFLVVIAVLGIKGAAMYFKQHEQELKDAIDPSRFKNTAAMILLLTVPMWAACAPRSAPFQTSPAAHGAVEEAPSELRNAVNWAATAVDLARTIQKVEIQAYRNGRVSDDAHRTIQTAFGEFGSIAEDALTLALDLTKTAQTRWASARAVGTFAAQLLDRIDKHLPLIVKGYADSLKAVLTFLNGDVSNAGGLQ